MPNQDGLGERRHAQDPSGTELDLLRLRHSLSAVPSFEFALRERSSRLAGFRHPSFARVRSIERESGGDTTLTIASDHTEGLRLSELLTQMADHGLSSDLGVAINLVRQLVSAIAILHENARDVAHGAIAPERLVVMPTGRLVVTEYVLGSALEQLLFSRDRYWTELRVALPRSAGLARLDHGADVMQIGVVALALVLGRPLKDEEGPNRLADLIASSTAVSADGRAMPLPASLRQWIERTLHLDPLGAFPSAIEARFAFDEVMRQCECDTSAGPLESLLFQLRHDPTPAASPANALPTHVEPPIIVSRVDAPAPLVRPSSMEQVPSAPTPKAGLDAARADIVSHHPLEMLEAPPRRRRMQLVAAAVIGLAVLGGGATFASLRLSAERPTPTPTGVLTVTTDPSGAQASVDGSTLGLTPITVPLPIGSHVLVVRGEHGERTVPVTIAAGGQVAQYLDLPKAPLALPVADVVPPPVVASVKTAPADAPLAGWLTVNSRFDVQLFEDGKLVGTSQSDRLMVGAGRHEFEMTNGELGYHAMRSVQVSPGKVTTLVVDAPKSTIALNAVPWAEVFIDGEKAGDTPLGNINLTIGPHDVVFRHPELGEQRRRVLLTLKTPVRLVADMRQK